MLQLAYTVAKQRKGEKAMTFDEYYKTSRRLASEDAFYQSLMADLKKREKAFLRIRENLSEEDEEALDLYIAACEELESRCGQLAADYYARYGAL